MRPLLSLALIACAGPVDTGDTAPPEADTDTDTDADTDADTDTDTDADTDTDTDADDDPCAPLPPSTGREIQVPAGGDLRALIDAAKPGDVFLLADGTWELDGDHLWVDTPEITIRSASGDRDAVVLDGGYVTTEIVNISASDVTVADLTLRRAYDHPIHVTGGAGDVTGTLIYNVRVVDPGQQAIKINGSGDDTWADDGVIACSSVEMTDAGRAQVRDNCYTGGIDTHGGRGWTVRDNYFEGFWCDSGLSEHAIHFWRSARDTLVERNVIVDSARGIGFGLSSSYTDGERVWDDDPCPEAGGAYLGHYGGVVRNNAIYASRAELFSSASGVDTGIMAWATCGAEILHNTVYTTQAPFSSIEWRFEGTSVEVLNNLVSHALMERTEGTGVASGNLEDAPAEWFLDADSGELHLAPGAGAIDAGDALTPGRCDDDIDGDLRDATPDVGADEAL